MDYIIFNQPGGFPLTTNILEYLQTFHKPKINALASMAGSKAIINGCEEEGAKVLGGNIVIDGEMYGLIEGIKQEYITIKEDKQTVEFENGENKATIIYRYAVFGTGANSYKWSEFRRVPDLTSISDKSEKSEVNELKKRIEKLERVNSPELADNSGILKLWGKPWSQEMTPGWVPADEWVNKILRGSKNAGYNIGNDSVPITIDNLPTIAGSIDVVQPYSGNYQLNIGSIGGGGGKWWMQKIGINIFGGGNKLQILPACRTVLFLKREGT